MTEFTTWRSLVDGEEIVAIPDGVVDNFEDADADPAGPYEDGEGITDYYSHQFPTDPVQYERTTDDVEEGSHALSRIGEEEGRSNIVSWPDDGLPTYPDFGDTVAWLIRDPGSGTSPAFMPAVVDESPPKGYAYKIYPEDNVIQIWKENDLTVDDSDEQIASESVTHSEGTWYWCEGVIPDPAENDLEFSLYELESDLSRGDHLATVSGSDPDYTDGEGIGWWCRRRTTDEGAMADFLRVLD